MLSFPSVLIDSLQTSTGVVVKQEDNTLHEAAGTGWWRELRAYLPDLVGMVKAGRELAGDLGLLHPGDTAQAACEGWAGGEPQAETPACGRSSCPSQ